MIRRGFFWQKGQPPEVSRLEGYHVACFPMRYPAKHREFLATLQGLYPNLKIGIHLPSCYKQPDVDSGPPHHEILDAIANAGYKWMRNRENEYFTWYSSSGRVIDMRDVDGIPRALARVHVKYLTDHFVPDFLFLDAFFDRISHLTKHKAGARRTVNEQWRKGMRLYATALRFRLGRAGYDQSRVRVVGNGRHTIKAVHARCFEGFPHSISVKGQRSLDITVHDPTWGLVRSTEIHEDPPHILVRANRGAAAENPRLDDLRNAVVTCQEHAPDAVIYDNSGRLMEVL